MSEPELSWQKPDQLEIDIQLFAIMLQDQLLCTRAASTKASRIPRKQATKQADTLAPRPKSPSCFERITSDVMLELCIFENHLKQKGREYMQEIYDFALTRSPKMEKHMQNTYASLLTTSDHVLMMAAIFFYIKWHLLCDTDTGTVQMKDTLAPNSFLRQLHFDVQTLGEIYEAAYAFERGRNEMTTMKSFVHTLVINHFKRVV